MSTISTDWALPSTSGPVARLLTSADLAAMPDQLPSGPVDFELHEGRLVLMSPTGRRHAKLQSRLCTELANQGERCGHGEVFTEVGVIIRRNPDTVFGPDLAFVSKRSMPIRESKEGYLETMPELVIEIRSKNDSATELNQKISTYLQSGVQTVWIVDPAAKTVAEHTREAAAPKAYQLPDSLQCEPIIPDFRLPLSDLFRE